MEVDLKEIERQVRTGCLELLEQSDLKPGDIFVLGCSSSEICGIRIGKGSNLDVGRVVVKTLLDILTPRQIYLAVQGCEHINRALAIEKDVALKHNFEIVTVVPTLHAGGSCSIAAFENFKEPVEIEHIVAQAGMDIGDTGIGMHIKHVQIPVRTSVKNVGLAHVTYMRSRPKKIGGERAEYVWDPNKYKNM